MPGCRRARSCNGEIFHATGLMRWGRDSALRLLGSRLMDALAVPGRWCVRYGLVGLVGRSPACASRGDWGNTRNATEASASQVAIVHSTTV